MYKTITLISLLSLAACSSIDISMQQIDKSPRGITITNVIKYDRNKAYINAEKHCTKYSKATRRLKTITQPQDKDDLSIPMETIKYECLKPPH